MNEQSPLRGRGTAINPRNRFERLEYERAEEWNPEEDPVPRTIFYRDASKSSISYNDSPDLGFHASINPYRGCEHGCVYCYARPMHEYLGLSSGVDFETRIMVKENAPSLLREELRARSWKPQVIALSGATDPYQPIERRLGLTRACLGVLAQFRNPVSIVTKNHLVTRDADVLRELARWNAVTVSISISTLDGELARILEPRTSTPERRLQAITSLRDAGIPVGVFVAPIIPALTDEEMPAILEAAKQAGAQYAVRILLRLPHAVSELFSQWLSDHLPERKAKILHRIRALRSGELNDARFASRMRGEGVFADQIRALFHAVCRRLALQSPGPELSVAHFRRVDMDQTDLFY